MGKKILYVEDNLDTAAAVKAILSKVGYQIDVVNNGREGVSKAKEGYDLFLLDIMLPDMSGWDIFERLRDLQNAKFVFISAIPVSTERREELRNAGVSDYITKPFTKEDLIQRVRKVIS